MTGPVASTRPDACTLVRAVTAPGATARLATSLAVRPVSVLRRGFGLVRDLAEVGLGRSTVAPHHADGRFTDPGWVTDPLRRRLAQAWLVTTAAADALLEDASGPLSERDRTTLREALATLSDLSCPASGTGPAPPGTAPVPGRDVAATPGAVVLRTPVFELLQYLPTTEQVHDAPVLVVPPLLHRYHVADLAPGWSLVEHLVGARHQVFALSWSDPGPDDAARDLDACAAAVLDAIEACTRICRSPRVTLLGVRSGGLLAAAVQAHLVATGREDRVGAVAHLGTTLDPTGTLPGFRLDASAVRAAGERASRDGVLDGAAAAASWTWRRGGEQVRPFAVDPARFDVTDLPEPVRRAVRHWSSTPLRMPAGLHADLVRLATGDPDRPALGVLGTRVDPHRLTRDAYLVAAADDPVLPWTGGLATARLLGGPARLAVVPGDQIGALLAPPARRAGGRFRAGTVTPGGGPDAWWERAERIDGSWWTDLTRWLAERSGVLRDAPPELGGRRMHPVHPAPGTHFT